MPIGIIVNALSVALGGLLGLSAGNRMSQDFKEKINMVFGCCSMGMGISSISLMENMPAVILSLVVGTALGLVSHLGDRIHKTAAEVQKAAGRIIKCRKTQTEEMTAELVTVIVLFCASGTGIYGSIVSGMTGDHNILMAKSALDFFTALVFSCSLGAVVSFVAIPQFCIFFLLYLCAGLIYPVTTPVMICDFKALGGLIMLATGFRMIKVKEFPIADMIPGMILVMPLSWLWTNVLLPWLG